MSTIRVFGPQARSGCAQDVEDAQEVTLPSGVRYTDLRIGGGQRAARGLLVILDLKLYANDELVQVCGPLSHSNCQLAGAYGLDATTQVSRQQTTSAVRANRTRRSAANPLFSWSEEDPSPAA